MPIPRGNWKETVLPKCEEIRDQLTAAGIRVKLDADESQTPGWKFAEYEMRGVPLRLEIGPKDIEKNVGVRGAPRHAREGVDADGRPGRRASRRCSTRSSRRCSIARATVPRRAHLARPTRYDEFKQIMEGRPGFVIAPWCGDGEVRSRHQGRDAGDDSQHPGYDGRRASRASSAASRRRVAWFAKASRVATGAGSSVRRGRRSRSVARASGGPLGAQGSVVDLPKGSSPTVNCRSMPPSANSKRRWARRRREFHRSDAQAAERQGHSRLGAESTSTSHVEQSLDGVAAEIGDGEFPSRSRRVVFDRSAYRY